MRNLLVLTASLVLIMYATGATASLRGLQAELAKFKPQDRFKFSHLSSTARGFHEQQSLPPPASNSPVCQEAAYTQLLFSAYALCTTQLMPLQNSSVAPTVDAHRAAWAVFCSSQCFTVIKTQVIGSKYWICLQPDIQFGAAEENYLCTNKDSNGDVCGLTMSRVLLTTSCGSAQTSTACGAIANGTCVWTASSAAPAPSGVANAPGTSGGSGGSGCQANPTQTLLSAVCGTCITGLNKAVNSQYPTVSNAVDTITGTKQICAKAPSGAYCLPILYSANTNNLFSSNATVAAFCSNSDQVACLSTSMGSNVATTISSAQKYFVMCAMQYGNVSASVNKYCLPYLQATISSAQSSSAFLAALCTMNANGTYCLPAFNAVQTAMATARGCGNVSSLLSGLGCCLGTAQSLSNSIASSSTDPTLIPPIPGYTPAIVQQTVAPAPGTDAPITLNSGEELSPNPGNGGLFAFAACGVTGLNQSLRVRCSQSKFSVKKNLLLKLDYAAVAANDTLKAAILLSLRRDVAANAGVSPDQITDDSISSTSQVQVTTSGRGLQAQATDNGVQYSYTIQGSSQAQVAAAAANVDAGVQSGFLSMSNTQSTVSSSCASCTGTSSAAAVGTVSSTTVGTPVAGGTGGTTGGTTGSTSSGAAKLGTLLAVIIATLAMLC